MTHYSVNVSLSQMETMSVGHGRERRSEAGGTLSSISAIPRCRSRGGDVGGRGRVGPHLECYLLQGPRAGYWMESDHFVWPPGIFFPSSLFDTGPIQRFVRTRSQQTRRWIRHIGSNASIVNVSLHHSLLTFSLMFQRKKSGREIWNLCEVMPPQCRLFTYRLSSPVSKATHLKYFWIRQISKTWREIPCRERLINRINRLYDGN